MKRLFTLLLISFAALSCEMIDEKLDDLLDKRDWVIFAEGTELTANVPSKQTVLNYKFESTLDWEVKTEAEWLEIDPMSGKAGKDIKIQIKVAKNKDKEGRTGYADLTLSNDESYRITINQAGEGDDVVVEIPNNQIWYTSIDGETVEPYSGVLNDYADAITIFGANIVSNTYKNGLGVITFDRDVTTIGSFAFSGLDYDSVNTTFVGTSCIKLESIIIPDSVTTIGVQAFHECSSLTSATIGDGVLEIYAAAFHICENLQEFKGKFASEDGRCLIVDGILNSFAPAGLTEYTIPNSVTTIGVGAFYWCSSLESVTIHDSVTTIGNSAFYNCDILTSVTIPDSVTAIGERAFVRCSSLQEFKGKFASEDSRCLIVDGVLNSFAPAGLTEYTIPNSVTTIGESAFYWCTSLTSVTIPDSVTAIGELAFAVCDSLTSVTIGDSVTTIGENAFNGCINLTSVTIPDSVTTIGDGAFSVCSSLTSVTIPNSVTEIGEYAFGSCYSLTSVTIPDSVTTIGEGAFIYCNSLTSVYCKATTPPAGGSYMFGGNASDRKIYVPMESVEAYKSASYWSDYADRIVAEEGAPEDMLISIIRYTTTDSTIVTPQNMNIKSNTYVDGEGVLEFYGDTIGYNAFSSCSSLTSVTIGDSVTTIGDGAFEYCNSLTSVTIPNSVTTIGDYAFSSCSGLTSATIPNSVTMIGKCAFSSCSSLTSVTIPNSVTTLRDAVFRKCSSLTSITIPDSITTIGKSAFYECVSIKNIVIPNSVTSIGDFAFAYCKLLTSVNIPYSVVSIGDAAFKSCNNLRMFSGKFASDDGKSLIIDNSLNAFAIGCGAIEYAIPNGVNMIGNSVFCNCWSLTSVTIPDSVTTIGELAFYGCSSLTSVYCKPTTPPAGDSHSLMFSGNASDREIYVPMGSVGAYKSAQGWSDYADDIVGYNF